MSATRLKLFAPPRAVAEQREDGTVLLRSTDPLGEHAPSMAHVFRRRAAEHPDRVLAAQRAGDEWAELTWGDAAESAKRIAQSLLARGLGPDRPLMVLSGNSLEHLQLMLGSFEAGVPILPISTAYSLMSKDHTRIRRIAELCSPGSVSTSSRKEIAPPNSPRATH